MSDNEESMRALKARGMRVHIAVHELYAALKTARHMVGERRRTKDTLRHLDDTEALVDRLYNETSELELTLYDVARMADELQQWSDQVANSAETAYQDGWKAALDQILDTVPLDSRELVAWLIHILQSDTAYREPVWNRIMELIGDARRYLGDNSEM